MMLTKAGEYAVRCMLYLAAQVPDQVIRRQEITRAMEIPNPFMAKIAQQLARAGLIQIVQGARGGYRLLGDPSAVTLLAVIEAVEGEIFLNECLARPGACRRSPSCRVHNVWKTAREALRGVLGGVTLTQLVVGEHNCAASFCDADPRTVPSLSPSTGKQKPPKQ
ncbi:MAG: Rrf2 family transcriptional regulator [Desulfatitalea sp.]|nr:Rrf2 family transcriptional regulator [Desulfatitalea sp.]